MTPVFIDSNILVYHLAGNHDEYSPRSTALIGRLSQGEEQAWCTSTVIVEAAFVLERVLRIPRETIADILKDFVAFPSVHFDFRELILQAIELWSENGPLSLPDAYHLVFAKDRGLTRIYTFDRKMNRLAGVERIES